MEKFAESEAKTISEDLREQRNKKLTQRTQRKCKREQSVEDDTAQPKKSFVDTLRGLMNEYKDKPRQTQPKNEDGPQRGAGNTSIKGKGPANGRSFVRKSGLWPPQTLKRTYRKNRYKLNHNYYLCMNHSNSLSLCNENSCNKNTCDDNQELVILSKQTLTQTQKDVLRKGLSCIPELKKLNIHQLHNDLRLFIHRMKCKFEFYHKPQ